MLRDDWVRNFIPEMNSIHVGPPQPKELEKAKSQNYLLQLKAQNAEG